MAFPSKGPSMPPPGAPEKKPSLTVAIGIPKPKEGGDPSADGGDSKDQSKLEGAGVVREDDHCRNCTNYVPEQGTCDELPGNWNPEDACIRYFTEINQDEDDNSDGSDASASPEDTMEMAPPA